MLADNKRKDLNNVMVTRPATYLKFEIVAKVINIILSCSFIMHLLIKIPHLHTRLFYLK